MFILNRLYSWYGKRVVNVILAVITLLLIGGVILHFASTEAPTEEVAVKLPIVSTRSIQDLESESSFEVTGTVRAVAEARLEAEAGGRVTNVNVKLGDSVRAGTVLASIENSRERAALLQAEGAYEAASAGAASSESGVETAETSLQAARTNAVQTYKSAFIAADSAIRNTADDLFSNPTSPIPGFRLESFGQATILTSERRELEIVLKNWSANIDTVNATNIEARLVESQNTVERIAAFIENIASIVARQDTSASFTAIEKDALEAEFLMQRTSLNQTVGALEGVTTGIVTAKENLDRARIAGSGNGVSLSSAQLKSALGTLRAAQSAYERTLVRTPISGVVNALYITAGEYISQGAPAVVVANNNALIITTMLGNDDADMVTLEDGVMINGSVKGIVTEIAPAIDPLSGKKEVKISVSDDSALTNGATVAVTFLRNASKAESDVVTVPLSALKITASGPVAFSVSSENVLVAIPVTIGQVLGDMVIVEDGLAHDSVIVTDARGLKEGEKVEVRN